MNKIVLTSSAMWLFDMIKVVMSSTVPEKKKIQKPSKTHKAKVTVTFLKEQNIQVLAHVTTEHIPHVPQNGFCWTVPEFSTGYAKSGDVRRNF